MRLRNQPRQALRLTVSALLLALALAGCGAKRPAAVLQQGNSTPRSDLAPARATAEAPATVPETVTAHTPPPVDGRPRPQPALPGAVGIMVENSWNARPQVGLDKADLVYEMEAEFGVSRFLALFYREKSDRIGPVRSARMHFYDVAVAHGIPYAHAGGTIEVLAELKHRNTRLLNIDEIYTCGACFWRSSDRSPPHNLYTSTDLLLDRVRQTSYRLVPLAAYPEGAPPPGGNPAAEVAYSWGPDTQDVQWTWKEGRYQRSQSGGPHLLEGGFRVETDNLVLLFARYVWDAGSNEGKGSYRVGIVGSGDGYLYRDGRAYAIRWSKPSRDEHFRLTLEDSSPVRLAPGQAWFAVLKQKEHVVRGASQ